MRRPLKLIMLFGIALVACAMKPVRPLRLLPVPFADDPAQSLFDDAIQWSRREHLETGGCFTAFAVTGRHVVITDAIESVQFRRPMKVMLSGCKPTDGIWHTHWLAPSDTSVGCDMRRANDLWLIGPDHPLGIVICGVGRDSVVAYTYDPSKQPAPERDPMALQRARSDTFYRCIDERPASLHRPRIACPAIPVPR